MEFTKKDIIIYKKLKQKLSRDKIKKLIKNQDEFDLPDEIRSVLSKFRVQNGGYDYGIVAGMKSTGYNVARGVRAVSQMDQGKKLKEKFERKVYGKIVRYLGCEETPIIKGMKVLMKETCTPNMPYYSFYQKYFPKLDEIFNEQINEQNMEKKIKKLNELKGQRRFKLPNPVLGESFYQWLLKNSKKFRDLDNISRNFRTYPNYESLQESPIFQQGYQDQMNKYLQESPEYNQGYQDGIEYLQENPNFEEQPLHEIEYYNQQVPLEENPNYVEYPQQQYPNTMETPYGDRYIINYN